MKESKPICLYTCNCNGMQLEVLEENGQRSLQSDRSIIHSRFEIDHPTRLIQPYQQQMLASIVLLNEVPKRVLVLGLGGGCQVTYLYRCFPDVQLDVIESSDEIIQIAKKYFHLPESPNITIHLGDAVNIGQIVTGSYDIILLDLCDSDGPILFFQELFYLQKLQGLLTASGWLAANTWSASEVLKKEVLLWKKVFSSVYFIENQGREAVIYGGFRSYTPSLGLDIAIA